MSVNPRVDPFQALEPREKRYITNRYVERMTKQAAALEAGYSPRMARDAAYKVEGNRRMTEVMRLLARKAVPVHKIAHVMAEGLEATKTDYFAGRDPKTGDVTDIVEKKSPDFKERREMAKFATAVAGYYSEKPLPEEEQEAGDDMPPERLGRLLAKALKIASEENGGAKVGIAMTYEKQDDPEEVERANSAWDRSVNG